MTGHRIFFLLFGTVWIFHQSVDAVEKYGYVFSPRYAIPDTDFVLTVDLKNFIEIKSGTYEVKAVLKTYSLIEIVSETQQFSDGNPRRDITLKIPYDFDPDDSYRVYVTVSTGGIQYGNTVLYLSRIYGNRLSILIQTDKGLYKAGQTVQFRVMIVNTKRIIEVRPMTIEIFDGERNRVRRWANVSDNSGVFVGKMEMSEYPVLGTWYIQAKVDGIVESQNFEVKEFELPKFDVTLNLPDAVSLREDYLEGSVASMYTFGKGVTGSVELVISYMNREFSDIYKLTDGEAAIKIELFDIEALFEKESGHGTTRYTSSVSTWSSTSSSTTSAYWSPNSNQYTVKVTATVTEDITGITRNDTMSVKFVQYDVQLKLEISSHNVYFLPGETLEIKGQVTRITGSPYEGMVSEDYLVTVFVTYRQKSQYQDQTLISKRNFTTNNRNQFLFNVDGYVITQEMESLKAEVDLVDKRSGKVVSQERIYFYLTRSTDGNFLRVEKLSSPDILFQNIGVTASYRIYMVGTGTMTATFNIISKGVVIRRGPWFSLTEDDPYDFEIRATGEMVPAFTISTWFILPNGRNGIGTSDYVAASVLYISVKGSPTQDTSIAFEEESVKPGINARLNLQSSPRSSFYILAVDKSVLLLDKGNDITESMLPKINEDPVSPARRDKYSTSMINNAGMKFQYFELRDPNSETFSTQTSTWYHHGSSSAFASTVASKTAQATDTSRTTTSIPSMTSQNDEQPKREETNQPKQETIRKKFPDTWLFMNVTAGSTGSASITRKVPDTITTWVASCFAVSAQSEISTAKTKAEYLDICKTLKLSCSEIKKEKLEVFLPFFISLQLPFSVIRNEQLVLQANIFNYHTEDLYVLVTLRKSSQFRGLAVVRRGRRKVLEERCGNVVLCIFAKAGRGTAAFFPIIPTTLGKIKITITAESSSFKDTVIKFLRVESEGAPRDVAYPILIDLTEEKTFETAIDLNYPPNTVEGSQRMRLSVIGDIMGPTIDGLERLVRIPTGCGEQNMIYTAPSLFVYKYLKAVGKLTDDLKENAEKFMRLGMQRQLRYKHSDWSFSAWGGSGSGSTWLTAFVLKVFAMASSYVEIDDQIVTRPAAWLISTQKADGSFPEMGNVIHKELQGGSSGTAERMTAYVLIALLEGRKASSNVEFCSDCLRKLDTAIVRASSFLSNRFLNQTSVYTVAISTYALTIAGHNSALQSRNALDDLSKGGGGQKYWEEPSQPPVSKYHYGRSTQAASIEMTAYALLAFTYAQDYVQSLLIQKWLIGQRNPYGGFVSTQDTVIALQGLAEIGSARNVKKRDMKIMVSYTDPRLTKKRFNINDRNAMNMQMADISTDTNRISVHAWGSVGSAAILTVSLFYNIFMDLEDRSLRLKVNVLNDSDPDTINRYTVRSCVSWLENEVSGMIVVEVGVPSGFQADRLGITQHNLLKRTEIEERKVVLYYDEVMFAAEICTDVPVVREKMVANVKPVPCKAYEYYEPSNEATVFYIPNSVKKSTICDICGIECGCMSPKEKLWFPTSWCKRKI